MSDADRSSSASMIGTSISSSLYVLADALGNDEGSNPHHTTQSSPTDSSPGKLPASDGPPATSPGPEMLTIVHISQTDKDTKENYGVIPFPETYEGAVRAVIKSLGKYMSNPVPENIILRCSTKNRADQWVWADIPPNDWKMTLKLNGKEVGVFERFHKSSPEVLFVHGHVLITVGNKSIDRTEVEWTTINRELAYPIMMRPKTFSEASDMLNRLLTSGAPKWSAHDPNLKDKSRVRFYMFPGGDLRVWVPIPLDAHSDDDIWRSLVPEPGKILGAMAE